MTISRGLVLGLNLGLRANIGGGVGGDQRLVYDYQPLNDGALPGGSTFTRGSIALYFDGTGYGQVSSGTIRDAHQHTATGAKGFIAEPAATNLCVQSSLFTSDWLVQRITATNDGVNVLGLTQHTFDDGTLNNSHRILDAQGTAGIRTIYTISKDGSRRYLTMALGGSSTQDFGCFDMQTASVAQSGSNVQDSRLTLLGSGFYIVEMTTDPGSTGNQILGMSDIATPGTVNPVYTGTNATLVTCHTQTEATHFVTTPIITNGSTVARSAEVLDTGLAIPTAFSCVLDLTLPIEVGSGSTITLLGPDVTAEDVLRVDENWNVIMSDGGTPVTIGVSSSGARIKVAYGRDGTGRSASLDGATVVTGGAPGAGHEGETFEIGSRAGVNQSRSVHHIVELYNERLLDAELQTKSTP